MSFRNHRLVLEGNRLNFESNKLRFENNRVNMEICALNRQTHSVSLQTSTLSREIAHLTRKSTEAGQSMGRISWISIEVNHQFKPHKLDPLMHTALPFHDDYHNSAPVF
jgi:hypothetical protein